MYEEIGRRTGKVEEVAREIINRSVLEFGRMRLTVEQFRDINTVLYIHSFGYSYPVVIREELQIQSTEEVRGVDSHGEEKELDDVNLKSRATATHPNKEKVAQSSLAGG